MTRQVTFNPYGITVRVKEGESLLSAALDAGVHGGRGVGGTERQKREHLRIDF